MAKYHVAIIGAGPGGLACAKKLAENGKKVIVIEKNEVIGDKVCAGGITAKEIGDIVPINLLGRTFNRGYVTVGGVKKKIQFTFKKNTIGTIPRERLGKYMAEEAEKAGAEIIRKRAVTEIFADHIVDEKGDRYYFDYLVGADGSNSLVRKYLSIPALKIGPTLQYRVPKIYDDIEIHFDLKHLGPFYIWIFPHDTFTEIGTGALTKLIPFLEVKKYFDSWLKEHKIDIHGAELRSFPINCDYQGFKFENIFLIGDAAGLTDAITGEGIYPAVISGQEAARKIIDPHYSLDKLQLLLEHKYSVENLLLRYQKHEKLLKKYGNSLLRRLLGIKFIQKKIIHAFLHS